MLLSHIMVVLSSYHDQSERLKLEKLKHVTTEFSIIISLQETEVIDKADEEEEEEDSGKDATEEALKAQAEIENASIPVVDDGKEVSGRCALKYLLFFFCLSLLKYILI